MPEFVACPACGCRVQMADSLLGRTVRCISCDHRFTASSPAEPETRRIEPLPPRRVPVASEPDDDRPPPAPDLPCCPGCGRRVAWDALRCRACGTELEIDPGYARFRRRAAPVRRDCEPHRGPLLAGMGNVALAAGGLALCVLGLPALVALPLGVVTWVMASGDLAKMRAGAMESAGRHQTESARTSAVAAVVLGTFFAVGWGLLALSRLIP